MNRRNRRARPPIKAPAGDEAVVRGRSKAARADRDQAAVEMGSGASVIPRRRVASATKVDGGIDRPDLADPGGLNATRRRRTGSNQLESPIRPVGGTTLMTGSNEAAKRQERPVAQEPATSYG